MPVAARALPDGLLALSQALATVGRMALHTVSHCNVSAVELSHSGAAHHGCVNSNSNYFLFQLYI